MKEILILLTCLPAFMEGFSQTTTPSSSPDRKYYYAKSREQKKVGKILLGTGGLVAVTGGCFALNGFTAGFDHANSTSGSSALKTGNALLIVGGVVMAASIPFFISAAQSKKKGMSVGFKNDILPQLNQNGLVYRSTPSLTLKLQL